MNIMSADFSNLILLPLNDDGEYYTYTGERGAQVVRKELAAVGIGSSISVINGRAILVVDAADFQLAAGLSIKIVHDREHLSGFVFKKSPADIVASISYEGNAGQLADVEATLKAMNIKFEREDDIITVNGAENLAAVAAAGGTFSRSGSYLSQFCPGEARSK